MEIPRGNNREDIKARRQIIKDFYAGWIAKHPDKKVWNKSLNAYIHVKNDSINETLGHAPRSAEATEAQTHLTEILSEAVYVESRPPKFGDKNQKKFSKMLLLRWNNCRVLVGKRKTVMWPKTVGDTDKSGWWIIGHFSSFHSQRKGTI